MNTDAALHLLLVDDDPTFTSVMRRSLQRKGCQIDIAANSVETLALTERLSYDLILLDLNLNGESGLQVLDQILLQQPQARIVMLTAYASIATAVDAIKRGAQDYLCKPVTSSDIMALLDPEPELTSTPDPHAKPLTVEQLEWEHLQRVLMEHDGNISATARALNMHRRTLQRKLQKRPVRG